MLFAYLLPVASATFVLLASEFAPRAPFKSSAMLYQLVVTNTLLWQMSLGMLYYFFRHEYVRP